jgi:hypothetical protein
MLRPFLQWNTSQRKILRYDNDQYGGDLFDVMNGHGTHVSATIIGSHINGIGADKEGIAPAATAHFFDICTASRCLSPQQQWFNSLNSHPTAKPKVLSASWGTAYLSSYDWTCYHYDKLVAEDDDILLISSAGNNGDRYAEPFSTIGAPASCKNTLAVGATFNVNFGPQDSVASFSSRGPTSDGRIKPDILAPGHKLNSASAGNHDCSREEPQFLRAGTSMSAPVISGSALLIREYFEEGFYPCGFRGCGEKVFPSGSLVKAVLINGAVFQKAVVHASTGVIKSDQSLAPYDHTQGFGATNLLKSLPLKSENDFGVFVRNNEAISLGEVHSFELDINARSCSSEFSVTLTWHDPPAAVGCTVCLVNDLDLLIEDISTSPAVKHYPNGRKTPDRINNVERIQISNSSGRRYRITVAATRLGPKYDNQKYSLVATGCFRSPDSKFNQQVTSHSSDHELKSSYRLMSKNRAAGIMFSVRAKSPGIVVKSFSITTHLKVDSAIFVYKLKDGGRLLNDTDVNDESNWEMISPRDGFMVNATGTRELTMLPKNAVRVPIHDGSSQQFYITLASEKAIICGSPRWASKQQGQKRRDQNIRIESGTGKLRLFAGRTIDPCFLDGSVVYSVETDLFV